MLQDPGKGWFGGGSAGTTCREFELPLGIWDSHPFGAANPAVPLLAVGEEN